MAGVYHDRYRQLFAPRTGDLRLDMASEAAEFLGIPVDECLDRMDRGQKRFTDEWTAKAVAPADPREVTRFYSESETELFDLLQWHATDMGNHRALACSDLASQNAGRRFLDYGSGIGTVGLIFAAAGFDVTLADVAEPLLRFARWRFERRGLAVRSCDLKREALPPGAFDAVVCFDVLEHILRPARTVACIATAMRPGGLLFLHAPFGFDPLRPMHVVYDDGVMRRMRALGYRRQPAAEATFPVELGGAQPRVYRRTPQAPAIAAAFYVRDVLMPARMDDLMSKAFRTVRRAAAQVGR
jgi:2-polyprenyl-3-methyl-5-hydroxy-6-metoxy-1,4-benzoquinol methylase